MNDTPDNSRIVALLPRIKEAIWKRRPILGKIMRSHGDDKLYDYARGFIDINPTPVLDPRKPELVGVAQELIARRLGAEVGEKVARQLTKFSLVSTADHHGFIDHPLWVNANIISASAVAGAILGAAIFWLTTRIYDQRKQKEFSISKFSNDLVYFTPVAFLFTLMVYHPILYFLSNYLLVLGNNVLISVIASEILAFISFLVVINIYRNMLVKHFGKKL